MTTKPKKAVNYSPETPDAFSVLPVGDGSLYAAALPFAGMAGSWCVEKFLSIAIAQLELHFCDDAHTEGYLKDGPRRFGSVHDFADDDERLLEQRNVSQMVAQFVDRVRRLAAPERP